eukprot:UN00522
MSSHYKFRLSPQYWLRYVLFWYHILQHFCYLVLLVHQRYRFFYWFPFRRVIWDFLYEIILPIPSLGIIIDENITNYMTPYSKHHTTT